MGYSEREGISNSGTAQEAWPQISGNYPYAVCGRIDGFQFKDRTLGLRNSPCRACHLEYRPQPPDSISSLAFRNIISEPQTLDPKSATQNPKIRTRTLSRAP